MSAFTANLHDPVTYAIPFFIAFMLLEFLSLRFLDEPGEAGAGSYERRDTRTNIVMGLGSVVVNSGARIFACSATRRCTS